MENKTVTYEMMHNTLHNVITGLEDKSMKVNEAKELSNACGKVITMGVGRLQYAIKQGVSMEIPELGITEEMLGEIQASKKQIGMTKPKVFGLNK